MSVETTTSTAGRPVGSVTEWPVLLLKVAVTDEGTLALASASTPEGFKGLAWQETARRLVEHVLPPLQTMSARERFESLCAQWKAETALLSNITQRAMHPAYQRIIGLGDVAVPFMLEEFRAGEYEDWFWALTAITGENPIEPDAAGNVKAMAEAWIAWGRQRGYLRS